MAHLRPLYLKQIYKVNMAWSTGLSSKYFKAACFITAGCPRKYWLDLGIELSKILKANIKFQKFNFISLKFLFNSLLRIQMICEIHLSKGEVPRNQRIRNISDSCKGNYLQLNEFEWSINFSICYPKQKQHNLLNNDKILLTGPACYRVIDRCDWLITQ